MRRRLISGISRFVSWFGVFRRYPIVSILILLGAAFMALTASWLAPHPEIIGDLKARFTPPFWYAEGGTTYLFGADSSGRDVLSRMMYGARVSLLVAVFGLVISGVVGTILGLLAGYYGRIWNTIVTASVDISLAMPAILIALTLVVILGPGFGNVLFVIAFVFWGRFARLVRGEVLSLKERDYVAYARMSGARTPYILLRHIMPGLVATLSVFSSLIIGQVILVEAALSFLGVGLPVPSASWGNMVADGREVLEIAWWVSVFPGLAITLVVLASNSLGDWMRSRFDPRLQAR